MKKSILVVTSTMALVVFGLFIAIQPMYAQTAMANGVVCPAGLICTPIVTANCPTGYICTPNTSNTSNVSTVASTGSTVSSSVLPAGTYIPGFGTTGASTGSIYMPGFGPSGTASAPGTTGTVSQSGTGASTPANSGGAATTGATTATVDSGYFDSLCSAGICNTDAGTASAIPNINKGPIVYTDPNYLATPSFLYGANADGTIATGTVNGSAPAANTLFNPDTWILNPSGQYYGFPCQNVGCIKPNVQNQITVAKLVSNLIGKSCGNEISFETAQAEAGQYVGGLSSLVSPSTLHLKAAEGTVEYSDFYSQGPFWPLTASLNAPFNPEVYDLCLDPGYVSNVPVGFDKAKIIALNTPKTQAIVVPTGPTLSSSEYKITATYNVTARYGKCVYFCGNTHIVHYPAGPKPVTVSIIQFNDLAKYGATIGEVLSRLLSIGYRPAGIDEITAIQSQAGDGIPYLGDSDGGPAFDLDGYAGIAVTNSKCPGFNCANEDGAMIYNGDKIAAVKL